MYGGSGGWPILFKISSKFWSPNSNLTTLPPDTVLSITSQNKSLERITVADGGRIGLKGGGRDYEMSESYK